MTSGMPDMPPPPAPNPYTEPSGTSAAMTAAAASSTKAPAIALICTASIGILVNLGSLGVALMTDQKAQLEQARQNLAAMPEGMREMMKALIDIQEQGGAAIQISAPIAFAALGALTLFGAIRMMKLTGYRLAIAGTIAAMVNCGTCCCVLGLPFGIWALVVLMKPEVKRSFT